MVVGGQVRRDQPQRGQGQGRFVQHVQDDREVPGRVRGHDPVVGRLLRQLEDLATVHEQGSEAGGEVQPAEVELRQVRDEQSGGLSLGSSEASHLGNQLAVRQA